MAHIRLPSLSVKHEGPGTVLVVRGTVVVVGARLVVVRRVVGVRAVVGGGVVGAATGATVVEVTGSVVVGSERGGDEVLVGLSALPPDEQAVAANRLARAAAEAMPSRRSHGRRRPRRLQARAVTTGPIPRCAAMARG
jgi:hypothetical protein